MHAFSGWGPRGNAARCTARTLESDTLCAFFVWCVFQEGKRSVSCPNSDFVVAFRIFLGLQHLVVTTD